VLRTILIRVTGKSDITFARVNLDRIVLQLFMYLAFLIVTTAHRLGKSYLVSIWTVNDIKRGEGMMPQERRRLENATRHFKSAHPS